MNAIVSYCNICNGINIAISAREEVLNDPDSKQALIDAIEDGQKLAILPDEDVRDKSWCDCEFRKVEK